MMFKKIVSILLFSALSTSFLTGETPTNEASGQISDERLAASRNFLTTVDMPTVMAQSIEQIVKTQIIQNRELYVYQDILIDYYTRYMGWEAIADQVITLYAAQFSAQELQEMTEFFGTETGLKVMKSMPELFQRTTILGSRNLQPHMEGLQEVINQRRQELMSNQ